LDHLPALRDRLAEQNVRVERFDVDVRREGNDGQRNTSQHEQQPSWQERQQQHSQAPHAPERRSSKVQSQAPLESINQPAISNSGINLVI
jgi:flagellar hook-length control protein FliK